MMYVFDSRANAEEVERILRAHPPGFTEDTFKIAFTNKGKLVHYEEEPNDLNSAHHDRVVFVLPKDKHYGEFSTETVFNVSGGESGEGKYFVLWDYCNLEQNGQAHKGPCPLLE
jgi:hypothetical protein